MVWFSIILKICTLFISLNVLKSQEFGQNIIPHHTTVASGNASIRGKRNAVRQTLESFSHAHEKAQDLPLVAQLYEVCCLS